MAAASPSHAPVLVGVDWGGSTLRVALLDADGAVRARRESASGVFAVESAGFAAALWPLCGDWLAAHRVPLLACGMIGSRQGLVEAPYVACPATPAALAAALVEAPLGPPFAAGGGGPAVLHVVPGVRCDSGVDGGVDLARGEETQLLGAAAAAAAAAAHCFVLPGTHSKWMRCGADGGTASFRTYLTGELFELLSRHGSLARAMAPAAAPRPGPVTAVEGGTAQHRAEAAFAQGLAEGATEALPGLLFRVRAAALTGRMAGAALSEYLSGLLIGAEVDAGLERFGRPPPTGTVALVGAAALTRRYAAALAAAGVATVEVDGDAVFAGLLAIARRAGLVAPVATGRRDDAAVRVDTGGGAFTDDDATGHSDAGKDSRRRSAAGTVAGIGGRRR